MGFCHRPKPQPCRVCGGKPQFYQTIWFANAPDTGPFFEGRFYCEKHLPDSPVGEDRAIRVRVGRHWHLTGKRAEVAAARGDCSGCTAEARQVAAKVHRRENHPDPIAACALCVAPTLRALRELEREYVRRLTAAVGAVQRGQRWLN
jgi:hypothetical protein